MIIIFHLAVLHSFFLYAHGTTKFTTIRQKHDIFNKNSMGRLGTGFGKRIKDYQQRSDIESSGKSDSDISGGDSGALFDDLLGRLSSGYGKRAKEIFQNLNIPGIHKIPDISVRRRDAEDDFLRRRLTDMLIKDIKRNSEFGAFGELEDDPEDTPIYVGADYQDPFRDWLGEVINKK